MEADAHFVIGKTHVAGGLPAQDYAVAEVLPNGHALAVVSDGCSSGGKTDIGARLVTLATAQALRQAANAKLQPADTEHKVRQRQIKVFETALSALALEDQDLRATCVYLYAEPGQVVAHIQGDGVVAWAFASGYLEAVRLDWARNAPAYPVYARDNFAAFVAYHGGDLHAAKLTCQHWRKAPDGPWQLFCEQEVSLADGIAGISLQLPWYATIVAVFSDGATQIAGLEWTDAIKQLVSFKTTAGQFAKRRLGRFIRDGVTQGYEPIDDLAYAVIQLDH